MKKQLKTYCELHWWNFLDRLIMKKYIVGGYYRYSQIPEEDTEEFTVS